MREAEKEELATRLEAAQAENAQRMTELTLRLEISERTAEERAEQLKIALLEAQKARCDCPHVLVEV